MTDSPLHDIPMEPGEDDLAFLRRVAASMPQPTA